MVPTRDIVGPGRQARSGLDLTSRLALKDHIMAEHAHSDIDRYDRNGLEILTRHQCLELLGSTRLGRVGISRYALPAILPVNYAMLGDDIVFATGTGSKSLTIADETVVAFEVDAVDPADRTGWSVLAVGKARPFDERDADLTAAKQLDLDPWLGRETVRLIRMPTELLSGRRITESTMSAHPDPTR